MKRVLVTGAAVCVAVCLGAQSASAACANLASSTVACNKARNCLKAIRDGALAYSGDVQTFANQLITRSVAGTSKTPQGYRCVRGVNRGQLCKGNNGGCFTGKNACNSNTDCAAGDHCDFGIGFGCNSASHTTAPALANLDVNECQPDQSLPSFSKDMLRAEKTLRTTITNACISAGVLPADIGLNTMPACPDAAPNGFLGIIECIRRAAVVAPPAAAVFDTTLNIFGRAAGTGAIEPKNSTLAAKDLLPRQVLQLGGASLVQTGTSGLDLNERGASGGAVTTLSLAHCSGGNGKPACLNNADCKSAAASGTCVANDPGSVRPITGPTFVHKCCDSGATSPATPGMSCATTSDCGSGTCSVNALCVGNVSTITQVSDSGGTFCLVNRSLNAGNGTAMSGSLDVKTGEMVLNTPVNTEIYSGGCPICSDTGCSAPGLCCSNEPSQVCSLKSIAPTLECTPAVAVSMIAPLFTPAVWRTTVTPLTTVAGTPFCGFCSVDSTRGCHVDADCGAGVCDLSGSNPGYLGDAAATTIAAATEQSQYAPMLGGIVCLGKTSAGIVNSAAGLPGPVRARQAVIQGYVFSNDK